MQSKIDNLIAKKLSGNATAQELLELNAWVTADEKNAAYFNEAEKVWKLSGALRMEDTEPDVNAAWSEFSALAGRSVKTSGTRIYPMLKIAAAIIFIVGTFFFVRLTLFPGEESQSPALASNVEQKADTFSSPQVLIPQLADSAISETPTVIPGKKAKRKVMPQVAMIAVSSEDSAMVFTLPDNSKVYLNKNSKLVYPEKFNKADRSVYLSGEAYFELASAPGDFVVYCHETRTRAIGSSFNIKGLRDGQIHISAINGDLEVTRREMNGQQVIVKAGEQVVYDTATHAISKSKLSKKEKWWKRGNFRMKVREFFNRIIHPRGKDSATTH